jgi:hypothetical protein
MRIQEKQINADPEQWNIHYYRNFKLIPEYDSTTVLSWA